MVKPRRHIIIPDTQVKPDVPTEHLLWAGRYIADKKPDVVIHLGDHWDMPSMSSYDRGKRDFEGRRYSNDILAGNQGMALLRSGMGRRPAGQERHFFMGNHEHRIERATQQQAELDGIIGYHNLDLAGWEVHDFLEAVDIDGVLYSHYFYNPNSGKPWGGLADNVLRHVGQSFVQGHRQGLDMSRIQTLPSGNRRRGIIVGSFYQHKEKYLGPQGHNHWNGILVLNEVHKGNFDVVEVSLEYLRRRYS